MNVHVVEVPAGSELEAVNRLNKNKRIAFAEPDMLIQPDAVPNGSELFERVASAWMQAPSAWHTPVARA